MDEHFQEEGFQFNPPEMDLSFLNENPAEETSFTAPSVENTLEEEAVFDAPVIENVEVASQPVMEEVSEVVFEPVSEQVAEFTPVEEKVEATEPVIEEVKEEVVSEAVPQFESPENIEFEMPSEFTAEVENTEEAVDENINFEVPNVENIPLEQDAQDRVANAIREKMSEMKEEGQDTSYNMTQNNEEDEVIQPVMEEEIEMPSFEKPEENLEETQEVSKEKIFADGTEKLKNLIKNESVRNTVLMEDGILTK